MRHEVVAVMRERPLGIGFKEQIPKHLKLLCSKGMVVSVEEKAGVTRQLSCKEMNGSEPLKSRRNYKTMPKRVCRGDDSDEHGRDLVTACAASGG